MSLKHTINCVPLITVGYVLLTLPEDTMRNRGYLRSWQTFVDAIFDKTLTLMDNSWKVKRVLHAFTVVCIPDSRLDLNNPFEPQFSFHLLQVKKKSWNALKKNGNQLNQKNRTRFFACINPCLSLNSAWKVRNFC